MALTVAPIQIWIRTLPSQHIQQTMPVYFSALEELNNLLGDHLTQGEVTVLTQRKLSTLVDEESHSRLLQALLLNRFPNLPPAPISGTM